MREILFRGKTSTEWVYGDLRHLNDGRVAIRKDGEIYPYEVIPETVGEYTGLTDKNGKKIFEGDILENRASENKEDWKRWVVAFYDGSFCFEREIPRKHKHKHEQNLLCEDEVKLYRLAVIGNIHDNPELLTEDSNG